MPSYAVQGSAKGAPHGRHTHFETNNIDEARKWVQYLQGRYPQHEFRIAPGQPSRRKKPDG